MPWKGGFVNQKTVSVEKEIFRSPLLPVAAVLLAAAAVSGVVAVAWLFHPGSIPAIDRDLVLSQIYDPGARQTWLAIYIAATVINCLGTLVLSVGMAMTLLGRHYRGMNLLFYSAQYVRKAVTVFGAVAAAYYVFRVVAYVILCSQINEGMMPMVSMLLMEALMGALAGFSFVKLRQFLDCCMDAAAGIGYTLSSGKLSAPTIPPFAVSGFLLFGLIDAVIALDRFFTFVHIQSGLSVSYRFPVTQDPVQILSGLSFSFAALGSFALYGYLRSYKGKSEKLLLRSLKNTET